MRDFRATHLIFGGSMWLAYRGLTRFVFLEGSSALLHSCRNAPPTPPYIIKPLTPLII